MTTDRGWAIRDRDNQGCLSTIAINCTNPLHPGRHQLSIDGKPQTQEVKMAATHRIKKDVKPYGGKMFEELRGTETTAIGWVHVSPAKIATGQRMFYRHELEAL